MIRRCHRQILSAAAPPDTMLWLPTKEVTGWKFGGPRGVFLRLSIESAKWVWEPLFSAFPTMFANNSLGNRAISGRRRPLLTTPIIRPGTPYRSTQYGSSAPRPSTRRRDRHETTTPACGVLGMRVLPGATKADATICRCLVDVSPNGWGSAAADPMRSLRGHERSECLRAYHSAAISCNAGESANAFALLTVQCRANESRCDRRNEVQR